MEEYLTRLAGAGILAVLCLTTAGAQESGPPAGQAEYALAQDASDDRVLEQLALGEALYRDDLIADALQRLYRISPNDPRGLAAEVRLAVRQEKPDEAERLLHRLHELAPGSPEAQASERLLQIHSDRGRAALTRARLYASAGRVDEARKFYDELFEGVYPTVDLALEYWQLVGRDADHREQASRELLALLEQSPSHGELLAAVANIMFRLDRPQEALGYLHRLGQLSVYRSRAAQREYNYLHELNTSLDTAQKWEAFIDRYGDLDLVRPAREQLAAQRLLVDNPSWQAGHEGIRLISGGARSDNAHAKSLLIEAVGAFPADPVFNGYLGLAYLEEDQKAQAIRYFEAARDLTPASESHSKWLSLIATTRYWHLLDQASAASHEADWQRAKRLYQQAHQLDPEHVFAIAGLADVAREEGDLASAERYARHAMRLDAQSDTAQRAMQRYLLALPADEALAILDALPDVQKNQLAETRQTVLFESFVHKAEQAKAEQRWSDASRYYAQAQQLRMDDPWVSYHLAVALRRQNREAEAMAAFNQHLALHRGEPSSHYAHALLLSAIDHYQPALDTLRQVPRTEWSDSMIGLERDVQDSQRLNDARGLYAGGQAAAAIALLEAAKPSTALHKQLARWYFEQGDNSKALQHYGQIVAADPDNLDARIGRLEILASAGQIDEVRQSLEALEPQLEEASLETQREAAILWLSLGDIDRAEAILERLIRGEGADNALVLRDLARLRRARSPQLALNTYAQALQAGGVSVTGQGATSHTGRDDVAFTRALRGNETDDWLLRSLRSEAAALYQQQNPELTVHHDYWFRSDGTPGLSRLHSNVTMVHLDYPVADGKVFIRADHVIMDAGKLETEADGSYSGRFGTCSFSARDVSGQWQALPGCTQRLNQKAKGTSVAVGWSNQRWQFDIGTTPSGFRVRNVVGGITYRGDIGKTGWSLTASRRPMSNSVLSFAGLQDPRTGKVWGGVVATGLTLGLSWDQGGSDGVWANLSYHRLTGKNVESNTRTRVMAGYYRRLINTLNEQFTAGVNVMHWRYAKDLGEFTLGHGGYYSPQRYSSVSLPLSYARRTANWSLLLEGSVSFSKARSRGGQYYPLNSLVAGPAQQLAAQGVTAQSFQAHNTFSSGSSRGVGYRFAGSVERRLSKHLVAGLGFDWQHSKDYSPNRFMLYLRYQFNPWKGDLGSTPRTLEPYADFR